MRLMESSASRIEAAVAVLTERVDALDRKLDDLVSDRVHSVSCSGDRHVENLVIEATPPASPLPPASPMPPASPIPSPCLVRASPSPSLVNAFAELYA